MQYYKNLARRLALLFLFWGTVWIVSTDLLIEWLVASNRLDHGSITATQVIKGLLFVAGTALLMYFIVKSGVAKLHITRKQYRNLFKYNPVAMFIFDERTGLFLAVNDSACTQYGYTEKEMKLMRVSEIRSPAHREEIARRVDADLLAITDVGIWQHRKKDGTDFWVHLFAGKTTFHNTPGRLVMAFDVQDEVLSKSRLEQQNKKLAEIAWFQSHQLRAPLATLQGLLHAIDFGNATSDANREIIAKLRPAAENLDQMVKELSHKTVSAENMPDRTRSDE